MEKPHGKEAVMKAIIEAAIPLIADRGVPSVTFRDIAAEAGVNHGLITHYFGTKDELIVQVSRHVAESMFRTVQARNEDLRTIWERGFVDHPNQIRAMVRILLDTPSDQATMNLDGPLEEMLKWVQAEQEKFRFRSKFDPETLLFLIAALMVGSELIAPQLKKVLHMTDEAFNRLRPRVFEAMIEGGQPPRLSPPE